MISAQSWGPVEAVQSLSSVIPKQMGGRQRSRRQRGGMQGFADAYAPPLMAGVTRMQSGASRRNRQSRRRRQRGGFAPIESPSLLIDSAARAMSGVNNQFSNESMVNALYNESKGPQ